MKKMFNLKIFISIALALLIIVGSTILLNRRNSFLVTSPKNNAVSNIQNLNNNLQTPSSEKPSGDLTQNFSTFLQEQISKNPPQNGKNNLGLPKTDRLVNDFLNKSLANESYNFLEPKQISLNTASDNSSEAISQYIQKANSITQKNLGAWRGQMLNIMKSLDGDMENTTKNLDPFILANKNTAEELGRLETPGSWENIAKSQIQLFSATADILTAIKNSNNDPLGALVALNQFKELNKKWFELQAQAEKQEKLLTKI